MKSSFFMGVAVAVVALAAVSAYAYWGGTMLVEREQEKSVAKSAVEEFTTAARAKVVAEIGQPIEGFEPFMFMQVYPGLVVEDFSKVDALIGFYRVENGEVVYDLGGEPELHSAARAISDEGMAQLLSNVSKRASIELEGTGSVAQVLAAMSTTTGAKKPANRSTLEGEITCLPHKGDGPHTMECAFGLETESGEYWALSNLGIPGSVEVGEKVKLIGVEVTTDDFHTKYDIVGTFQVARVEKL